MTYEVIEGVQSVALRLVSLSCGSGLGELAEDLDKDNDMDVFPYKDIPNFPATTGSYSVMHVSNTKSI